MIRSHGLATLFLKGLSDGLIGRFVDPEQDLETRQSCHASIMVGPVGPIEEFFSKTSDRRMILRFRVDFDQGFQVFRIAVEITSRQLVEPLPLCLAHQSGVQGDNPASCLIPCLDGLTLILVEEGCHFGAVVQNQHLVAGKNLLEVRT